MLALGSTPGQTEAGGSGRVGADEGLKRSALQSPFHERVAALVSPKAQRKAEKEAAARASQQRMVPMRQRASPLQGISFRFLSE